MSPRSLWPRLILAPILVALGLSLVSPVWLPCAAVAWADDDDGGEDGGDDGGDDDRAGAGPAEGAKARPPVKKPVVKKPAAKKRPATPPPAAPAEAPENAPDEIVVTGLSEADLALLNAAGFAVIERQQIVANGPRLLRLRIPPGRSLTGARAEVRALPTGGNADFNHYYRHSEGPLPISAPARALEGGACHHLNCDGLALIGWPAVRPQGCAAGVLVAVIDTGINPDHAGLSAAAIELARLTPEDAEAASLATHGTAVLSLLVGQEARAPGLVPEAQVLAIDVFTRAAGDERADVVSVIRALDLAVQRGARVANLSLAGPENTVLADMLHAAEAAGLLVVAAAGNAGPMAPPAWPAAHHGALAVTAVDPGGRIYRKAQRGPHIDLAAPGVDVWAAAAVKGVKPRTGTSYAVPHVTAAAAVLASRHPDWTPAQLAGALRGAALDAGAAGPDEVFGAGLLSAAGLCDTAGE